MASLLIVDDEEAILFSLDDYFTELGWDVDCARGVAEANVLADARRYDAVVTDLHLTGLRAAEGLELVSSLRLRGGMKVIVLTAYASEESERAAMACGADAFLEKTIPIWELADVASRLVGLSSSEPEDR